MAMNSCDERCRGRGSVTDRQRKQDAATGDHLARSDAQRRFDAWFAIANKAAGARAAEPGGSQVVTNVGIDEASFSDQLRRFAGLHPDPDCDLDGGDPVVDPEPGTRLRLVQRVVQLGPDLPEQRLDFRQAGAAQRTRSNMLPDPFFVLRQHLPKGIFLQRVGVVVRLL